MIDIDLDLLNYCRDSECDRDELHLENDGCIRETSPPQPRAVRVARGTVPSPTSIGVGEGLLEVILRHVGLYVPIAFTDLWDRVSNDYGPVADRSIQRGLAHLISERQVASIGSSIWSAARQRTIEQPGFYVLYDSPKLWAAGGLRDMMRVVAEHGADLCYERAPKAVHTRDPYRRRQGTQSWSTAAQTIRVNGPSVQEVNEAFS